MIGSNDRSVWHRERLGLRPAKNSSITSPLRSPTRRPFTSNQSLTSAVKPINSRARCFE